MVRELVACACLFAACGKDPAPTVAPAPAASQHADTAPHDHKAPHGGMIQSVGDYHLEALPSKVGLMVFLLDKDERELPVADVTGTVLLSTQDGQPPSEVPFEAMGNHLHAMVTFAGAWTAVVALNVNGHSLTARYQGNGVGVPAHDHAMPAMKLSDTVAATVTSAPPEAGKPVTLGLSFRVHGATSDITDFEVVHEQRLHTFVVSDDMSFFAHVHPQPVDTQPGLWTLVQVFPAPGTYYIYNDLTSTSVGPAVTRSTVTVPGTAPAPEPLMVDTAMTKTFGGLQVMLMTKPAQLTAGDAILEYTVSDASGPVHDLEPYLGAFGHLFILKDDKVTMAHAHPSGAAPAPGDHAGPTVSFHTVLPAPGRYKLWAQLKRGGQVVTTDWTVDVR